MFTQDFHAFHNKNEADSRFTALADTTSATNNRLAELRREASQNNTETELRITELVDSMAATKHLLTTTKQELGEWSAAGLTRQNYTNTQ